MQSTAQPTWRDYLELCKPRVVLLMLLCALARDVPRVSGFGTIADLVLRAGGHWFGGRFCSRCEPHC